MPTSWKSQSWRFPSQQHGRGLSLRGVCIWGALHSGPKKPRQPETWQDSALFSPPGNRAIFSTFWGDFLTKLHSKPGEKGNRSTGENAEKIQWRRRPEIADFWPLSWSNASWFIRTKMQGRWELRKWGFFRSQGFRRQEWGSNLDPHPQPQNSLRVCKGNSYEGEPDQGRNCSHCNFQELQVSLVRTFLSDPGLESKMGRLGGRGGGKVILKWSYTGGGANTVLFGKNALPLLLHGFVALKTENMVFSANEKLAFFSLFGYHQVTVKIGFGNSVPSC